jgi:hypothetical protein
VFRDAYLIVNATQGLYDVDELNEEFQQVNKVMVVTVKLSAFFVS